MTFVLILVSAVIIASLLAALLLMARCDDLSRTVLSDVIFFGAVGLFLVYSLGNRTTITYEVAVFAGCPHPRQPHRPHHRRRSPPAHHCEHDSFYCRRQRMVRRASEVRDRNRRVPDGRVGGIVRDGTFRPRRTNPARTERDHGQRRRLHGQSHNDDGNSSGRPGRRRQRLSGG